ncbi:MAG TPA: capsule assembly Wzi family protein, partial [Candidatus Acidoferrum sp.]|nr:capsule assembly Wzi family protein [Candidatus Acidoferrum sp.]
MKGAIADVWAKIIRTLKRQSQVRAAANARPARLRQKWACARIRHPGPLGGLLLTLLLTTLFPGLPSHGAGLVEMPLKPWTYFELTRDWTYTAIEKLVTAGLVGPWVLNTKPMSRNEMARVVVTALRKIQEDQGGRFANRTDLEPVLYELMEEFAPELEAMAVRNGTDEFAGQPWLSIQPLSHLQVRGFYTSQGTNLENSQGLRLPKGFSGTAGFDSYLQIHDFLSGYIYPEFQVNPQGASGSIVEGYLKLKYNNLALLVGRESVWWGPGYHGSMMVGNNAAPQNQFRLYSAEPFYLPGFFKYLGPTRMELMYTRLDANRDHPHTMLGSWRIDFSPLSLLELGMARQVQMDGQGRPSMSFLDYLLGLFYDNPDPASKFHTEQIYTLDGTIRLHDVDRVFPLSRDVKLYGEI